MCVEVCITLRPVGNRQGSWRMLKLVNGKIVSRLQFKEIPMTDMAKARLDELALLESNGQVVGGDDEVDYEDTEYTEIDNMLTMSVQNVELDFPLSADIINDTVDVVVENSTKVEDVDEEETAVEVEATANVNENVEAASDVKNQNYVEAASDVKNRDSSISSEKTRKHWNKRTHTWDSFIGAGNFNVTPTVGRKRYGV